MDPKVIEHFDNRIDGLVNQLSRIEARLNQNDASLHQHFKVADILVSAVNDHAKKESSELEDSETFKSTASRLGEVFKKMQSIRPSPPGEPMLKNIDIIEPPSDEEVMKDYNDRNGIDLFFDAEANDKKSSDTPESLNDKVMSALKFHTLLK